MCPSPFPAISCDRSFPDVFYLCCCCPARASPYFAEQIPDEMVPVFALVNSDHKKALRDAGRDVHSVRIGDVVQSVRLFQDAVSVGPSIGLPCLIPDVRVCTAAAREGKVSVLIFAVKIGCPIDMHACWYAAIEGGHLRTMAWLRVRDRAACEWEVDNPQYTPSGEPVVLLEDGTINSDLHFQHLLKAGRFGGPCGRAAAYGQLDALMWLRSPNRIGGPCPVDNWATAYAARGGYIDMLRWMRNAPDHEGGILPWDGQTCAWAANRGDIAMLTWLRYVADPPAPWCWQSCCWAAQRGRLKALRWMRQVADPPCPWSRWCVSMASANGHLDVVRFLRDGTDPPCPWEAWACRNAVEHGRLDVLQYLRVECRPACPWDAEIRRAAVKRFGAEAVASMGEWEDGTDTYRGVPWRFEQEEQKQKLLEEQKQQEVQAASAS